MSISFFIYLGNYAKPLIMNILLNNKSEKLLDGTTIQKLLEDKNIKNKLFAVEIDRKIIPKSVHCKHIIKDGDRIEIITAIGGG